MTHIANNLNLDQLRRIQATLRRRGQARDQANIRSVGFAPVRLDRLERSRNIPRTVTAQFDVRRKLARVADSKRVKPMESVRLLDRSSQQFAQLTFITDVEQTGDIEPTGVRIDAGTEHATTSAVVRWTKMDPVPEFPSDRLLDDPRWRWGVISVAHLFTALTGSNSPTAPANIERRTTCGVGPKLIQGKLIARGRVPGGPDISLVETGLDRLWLSGFLVRPDEPTLLPADERQLMAWVMQGTDGILLGDGRTHSWNWRTYYPELTIDGLGKLQQVIRYEVAGPDSNLPPLGPGSSGGVLVAGGIPIGMHVAAIRPRYRIGYAQTFHVSLSWLRARLRASALQLVSLLVDDHESIQEHS